MNTFWSAARVPAGSDLARSERSRLSRTVECRAGSKPPGFWKRSQSSSARSRGIGRASVSAEISPVALSHEDPALHLVQRIRDEAHRFAIGSHRTRRTKSIREGGLQEIPGIGPTRKRALLHHFGTLKAIERASVADLSQVPGVNAETAKKIYDFFHEGR